MVAVMSKPGTAKGALPAYYRNVVLNHDSDACLIWPYGHCKGYGRVCIGGRAYYIHRLACEHFNGPPPSPKHEAAHTCGKGSSGCCAPGHLVWKTPVENAADKLIHGTERRGERQNGAKLTEADVRAIRALKETLFQRQIAEQFGISQHNVGCILRGETWTHVEALP